MRGAAARKWRTGHSRSRSRSRSLSLSLSRPSQKRLERAMARKNRHTLSLRPSIIDSTQMALARSLARSRELVVRATARRPRNKGARNRRQRWLTLAASRLAAARSACARSLPGRLPIGRPARRLDKEHSGQLRARPTGATCCARARLRSRWQPVNWSHFGCQEENNLRPSSSFVRAGQSLARARAIAADGLPEWFGDEEEEAAAAILPTGGQGRRT